MFFGLNQNSRGLNINHQIGDAKICFFPVSQDTWSADAFSRREKYWKILEDSPWWVNITIEHGPFIADLPTNSMMIFNRYAMLC